MKNYYWGLYWYKSQQTFRRVKVLADSFAEAQEKIVKALTVRGDITLCFIFPYAYEGAD